MKSVLKKLLANLIAILLLTAVIPQGFKVAGGPATLLILSLLLAFVYPLLRKLLNVVLLPLNLLTLGLVGFMLGGILFYLITLFVPQVQVAAQTYPAFELAGFMVKSFTVSRLWVYVAASFLYSFFFKISYWILS